jgi:hypothetical protein
MHAIPEDETELLTLRSAIVALEESGRPSAARVLALNPRAPVSHRFNGAELYTWYNLQTWADELYGPVSPDASGWSSPAYAEAVSPP